MVNEAVIDVNSGRLRNMQPRVKAWAVIARGGQRAACFTPGALQYLVQCDDDEAFYRFPGGDVEWGETAARTIVRELVEEFDLEATVGPLMAVAEQMVQVDGREYHEVVLVHRAEVSDARDLPDTIRHNERADGKVVWRTLAQLAARPLYPEGILPLLEREADGPVVHLVRDALNG
jgi:8-oxo-dGTP diphosphatase